MKSCSIHSYLAYCLLPNSRMIWLNKTGKSKGQIDIKRYNKNNVKKGAIYICLNLIYGYFVPICSYLWIPKRPPSSECTGVRLSENYYLIYVASSIPEKFRFFSRQSFLWYILYLSTCKKDFIKGTVAWLIFKLLRWQAD